MTFPWCTAHGPRCRVFRALTTAVVIEELQEGTCPKSILISTAVARDCPFVLGDSTDLAQILMNLCINAHDPMQNGGSLAFEAESMKVNGASTQLHPDARSGEYVLLKVSDTGTGMSMDVLD